MTEREWFVCTNPQEMLEYLQGRVSVRKLRLLAVACCRSIWDMLIDERSRRAVELAEQSADHPVSSTSLDAASGAAEEAFEDAITDDDEKAGSISEQLAAACYAASYASNPPLRVCDVVEVAQAVADAASDASAERTVQLNVLRDIFGNPFRPVSLAPAWITSQTKDLAQAAYENRDFDSLPILADALEEAGCEDEVILGHCRGPGPHVKGCWVIDLLLGKE